MRTHLLPSERAALSQSCLTTGGLAENGGASLADDNGLGVREDSGDGEAAGALDIHEEGSGTRHKGLYIVLADVRLEAATAAMSTATGQYVASLSAFVGSYLELVLLGLSSRAGVEEIDSENLDEGRRVSIINSTRGVPATHCGGKVGTTEAQPFRNAIDRWSRNPFPNSP